MKIFSKIRYLSKKILKISYRSVRKPGLIPVKKTINDISIIELSMNIHIRMSDTRDLPNVFKSVYMVDVITVLMSYRNV